MLIVEIYFDTLSANYFIKRKYVHVLG